MYFCRTTLDLDEPHSLIWFDNTDGCEDNLLLVHDQPRMISNRLHNGSKF